MNCRACKKEIPDGSAFCCYCGKKQEIKRKRAKRANGTGSILKTDNGRYKAVYTVGYYTEELNTDGTIQQILKRQTKVKRCRTFAEASAAIEEMKKGTSKTEKKEITFQKLYEQWLPTHRAGASTMDCYKAAMKHFKPIWTMKVSNIDVDDLQECLDICGKGKRTQENMKALCGLVYKFGIPRHVIPENLNLAEFLKVSGEKGIERESFTQDQIEAIKNQIGKTYGAEYVYSLIYLGFRPSEFLDLECDSYNEAAEVITGGSKTEAGINRGVTVSPKIQKYIKEAKKRRGKKLFCDKDGNGYRLQYFTDSVFYNVLEAAGIENPMIDSAGRMVHKYTPHSCRHTFATLMKRVPGDVKDKCKLIGHSSEEMLRYYQDVSLEDLKKITDII